jgi:hypothetical protein
LEYIDPLPAFLIVPVALETTADPRPYFEEQDGFDIDGLKIKSRLDVGIGTIDFRGLYKNPGA